VSPRSGRLKITENLISAVRFTDLDIFPRVSQH
jgi:hypothetical protein